MEHMCPSSIEKVKIYAHSFYVIVSVKLPAVKYGSINYIVLQLLLKGEMSRSCFIKLYH